MLPSTPVRVAGLKRNVAASANLHTPKEVAAKAAKKMSDVLLTISKYTRCLKASLSEGCA